MQAIQLNSSIFLASRALVVGSSAALAETMVELGLDVQTIESAAEAARLGASSYDIAFVEKCRSGISSGELIRAVDSALPGVPIIALVDDSAAEAVEAMKAGADDCLARPISESALLRVIRAHTGDGGWVGGRLAEPVPGLELDGSSSPLREAARSLARLAEADMSAVLITGPSGAGKTRGAHFLHAHRPQAPKKRASCACADEAALGRELFGDGTPEDPGRTGLWALARGGFLILEDIPSLPLRLQRVIAGLLEAQAHERRSAAQRVRVIATATGDFRGSAFPVLLDARLSQLFRGAHVHVPSLAERPRDIRILGRRILDELARRLRRRSFEVPEETWATLERLPWPENIKALQSALQRAAISAEGDVIRPGAFERVVPVDDARPQFLLPEAGIRLEAVERSLVQQALARSDGNRTRAGLLLGLNRDQVRYRIDKFGLEA